MDRATQAILFLFLFFVAVVGLALYFSKRPATPYEDDGTGGWTAREGAEVDTEEVTPEPLPDQFLEGTVVDVFDDAVPDAHVILYSGPGRKPRARLSGEEEDRRDLVADMFHYFPRDLDALHPVESAAQAPTGDEEPVDVVRTDARGRFAFRSPPRDEVRLVAQKEGLRSATVRTRFGEKPPRLVLAPSSRLKGTVWSQESGQLVSGSIVRLVMGDLYRAEKTGEDGAFRFDDLPAGTATLLASKKGYAGGSATVNLAPGEAAETAVALSRGHRLAVTVRGFDPAGDGHDFLLPYARVAAVRTADDAYAMGVTGQDGRIVFDRLPPGTWLVNGRRKGYLLAAAEEVTVPEPEGTEVQLMLEKATTSTIRAVDEHGTPLSGVSFWTGNEREEFEPGASRMVGTTNRLGEIEYPFERVGSEAVLFARKPGYAIAATTPETVGSDELLEVVMLPGIEVRGRITDRSGDAVSGAVIYVEAMSAVPNAEGVELTIRADEGGSYRFAGLPPGKVRMYVSAPGHERSRLEFRVAGRGRVYERNVKLARER